MVAVTPFTEFDALFMRGGDIETAKGVGLDSGDPAAVAVDCAQLSMPDEIAVFAKQADGLILGVGVARRLGVKPGDELTLIVPGTRAGRDPGPPSFNRCWSRYCDTGTELDQAAALVPLALASGLAGLDGRSAGCGSPLGTCLPYPGSAGS